MRHASLGFDATWEFVPLRIVRVTLPRDELAQSAGGPRQPEGKVRWIVNDFLAGEFRTRADAERHVRRDMPAVWAGGGFRRVTAARNASLVIGEPVVG